VGLGRGRGALERRGYGAAPRYGAAPPLPPEVPVPPPVVGVWVWVPGTPAPPEPPAPVFPDAAPPPVLPVEPAAPVFPEEDEEEPVLPEFVLVVVVVPVEEVMLGGALLVGTVSVGAPAVFAVDEPPPPQAEMPTARAKPAKRAASELVMRARREVTAWTSGPEWVHPPSAVRAVV
jgi:hypothetical protein